MPSYSKQDRLYHQQLVKEYYDHVNSLRELNEITGLPKSVIHHAIRSLGLSTKIVKKTACRVRISESKYQRIAMALAEHGIDINEI